MNNNSCPLPPLDLLGVGSNPTPSGNRTHTEEDEMQQRLIRTLAAFRIKVGAGPITRGPRFTRYEFIPPEGLRLSRIARLRDELKLATGARCLHLLTPVVGKNTVGMELPNSEADAVCLGELLEESQCTSSMLLPIALGKDVEGKVHVADLATLPHLLVAGCPGSGRSVFLHSALLSLLMELRPEEMRLVLIDPTEQDLHPYAALPHLACPLLTTASESLRVLRRAVKEMERRFSLFSHVGVRNIEDYNTLSLEAMPRHIIVISELADLMMEAKDELEAAVSTLTQKAAGAGIHLIIATQVPRSNVLTNSIKAHIPCRLAFRVASPLDSRIVINAHGAEYLLGAGDALFVPPHGSMQRVQGAKVSAAEVAAVVQHCVRIYCTDGELGYLCDVEADALAANGDDSEMEELYKRAVELVLAERGRGITSFLQRKLTIGYGKAARIAQMMEARDIITSKDKPARAHTNTPTPPHPTTMSTPNTSDKNLDDTLLHRAAREGNAPCVHFLLDRGFPANTMGDARWTPLHAAADRGHADCVRLLLAAGADHRIQDSHGETPLHWAARKSANDCAKLLLEHGAPVDATDDAGWTPLCWALRRKHDDCVALLLQHGATPCPPEKAHQEEAVDKEERVQRAFFQGIPTFIR